MQKTATAELCSIGLDSMGKTVVRLRVTDANNRVSEVDVDTNMVTFAKMAAIPGVRVYNEMARRVK